MGLLAATAILATPAAAQLAAYHDASGAVHQQQYNQLSANGYRMIALSCYGPTNDPQYAAVWVQRAGPSFVGFHGLDAAQYSALLNANAGTHAPKLLTACGSAGNPRFAGVLETVNYAQWVRHGLTEQALATEVGLASAANRRIATIDCYGNANDTRYVVAFEPQNDNKGWGYYIADGVSDHQDRAEAMVEGYCRPVNVAFNDDSSQFVAVWHDTRVGNYSFAHDLTSGEYNTMANQLWNDNGWYPINVQGSGSGNNARFSAIFAATDLPQARQWSQSGPFSPDLAGYDGWMQNWMQSTGTRAASMAIVKNGKLVFSRGYTFGEPGYPQTQPTSRFRIASCVKPLTSIAVHQEIAKDSFAFNYDMTTGSTFGNPVVADPQSNTVTVFDLLTHQGGWDRGLNQNSYDPMFRDVTIANALNLTLPISTTDIRTYMQQQPLDFAPGSQNQYSNYGFSLLGRMLEVRNPGQTFAQILQGQVFGPLGITGAVIGRSYTADALPGEVLYHPQRLRVASSVVEAARPYVISHHGGFSQENMDAHGAYVMSAPEYAKVLGAFHFGLFNPLLSQVGTTAMWTPENPGSGWLKGWFDNAATGFDGNAVSMVDHNGILPGTNTYVAHRRDGLSFVVFTNGDVNLNTTQGLQLSNLANSITAWPNWDLFATMGLPPFQQIDDLKAPYGSGCPGTGGVPQASGSGDATIGGRLSFDLDRGAPNALALCVLGFNQTSVPLDFLGATGCTLLTDPALNWTVFTDAAGRASQAVVVPVDPRMVGLHVFAQFGVVDARANTFGLAASNGVDVTIGGWIGQ
jgi:CubicO group peptidase (beta-lactamase class C family)